MLRGFTIISVFITSCRGIALLGCCSSSAVFNMFSSGRPCLSRGCQMRTLLGNIYKQQSHWQCFSQCVITDNFFQMSDLTTGRRPGAGLVSVSWKFIQALHLFHSQTLLRLLHLIQKMHAPRTVFLMGGGMSSLLWDCIRREWEKSNPRLNFISMAWNIHFTICTKWLRYNQLLSLMGNKPQVYQVYSIYHPPLSLFTW